MAYLTNAPRGTQDVLPPASGKWQYLEETARDVAALWGFGEIRIPTFEHTELFSRSVGDTTDVVQKEMYTFNDKAGRSITLRPEGTAGVMRAILQNGMLGGALPLKLCYLVNCFRYEKPQAGRLREFHQFGVEMAGAASHVADAQVIGVAKAVFDALGVTGLRLELNSIGCPECRARYHEALKAYFASHLGELCETCRDRSARRSRRTRPRCSTISAATAAPTSRASKRTSTRWASHIPSTRRSCAGSTTTPAPSSSSWRPASARRAPSAAAGGTTG